MNTTPEDQRKQLAGTVEPKRRGWLKNGNPPGDYLKAPGCGAKNRRGAPCQCPAMPNGRCRLHGLSTGPKTAEGIERIRRAVTKHGAYSGATKAARRECKLLVQRTRELMEGQTQIGPRFTAELSLGGGGPGPIWEHVAGQRSTHASGHHDHHWRFWCCYGL